MATLRRRRFLNTAYRLLYIAQWLAGVVAALVGASLKADPVSWASKWAFAGGVVSSLQNSAWLTLPGLTLFLGVAQLARSMIGPPWVWDAVHQVLDLFRGRVFRGEAHDPLHYHRVTLFKHVGWRWCLERWPWSGWLVPVERSAHTTRTTKVVFRAPDQADRSECVAGQTWSRNKMVVATGLPNLQIAPTDADFLDYSTRTWVAVPWLRREPPSARSFAGVPVEVKGKLWGVIVLDSRGENAIKTKSVTLYYRLVAPFLSKLLERL